MRPLAVVLLVAACEAGHVPLKPLPPLVAAQAPVAALDTQRLLLPRGSLIWDVHWDGLTIARAELVVGDGEARSRFATTGLASAISSIHHELATDLDRARDRALSFDELLDEDGSTTHITSSLTRLEIANRTVAVPGGNRAHTLHSALGALRAWAAPNATPGFLYVVHVGRLYRLDVASPTSVDLQNARTLRIDAHVRDADITMSLWLTADEQRTPVRIEITRGDAKLVAELVDP